MKKIWYFLLPLILLKISGCECVPEITGPKQIEPDKAAGVAFINSISGRANISIEMSEFIIDENISNNAVTADYSKAPSGTVVIRAKDLSANRMIYQSIADFKEKGSYTGVFYGSNNNTRFLSLSDSIAQDSKSYIRFINVNKDTSSIIFKISGNVNEIPLKFTEHSSLIEIKPGAVQIEAILNSVKVNDFTHSIQPGMIYNIINEEINGGRRIRVVVSNIGVFISNLSISDDCGCN